MNLSKANEGHSDFDLEQRETQNTAVFGSRVLDAMADEIGGCGEPGCDRDIPTTIC